MPIDRSTALRLITDATQRVWATWGAYIPPYYRVASPGHIFILHMNEASLRIPFTPVWNELFKTTVQSTDPAETVPLPGGFVTPQRNRLERKIHINLAAAEFDWVGLFAHEYIHWLSHENFFPLYYGSMPGKTNDIVEGATDYLMLKCFHGYADGLTPAALQQYHNACLYQGVTKLKKQERAAYNWKGQYTNMSAWVKSSPGNEAALVNFVFNGVAVRIPI